MACLPCQACASNNTNTNTFSLDKIAPLPSTSHLLSALSISHRSFFESLKYLVHRLADVSSSTAFLINPVCCLAGRFGKCTWATTNSFGFVLADARYSMRTGLGYKDFYRVFCNVVTQCQLARELVTAIEAQLIRDEALLISKLRGLYGQERFFRFAKQHLGLWSTRIDLLDDIPDIISSIWQSCLTIMECLDYIERYSRILLARFQDKGWVSRHQGLPELRWCLECVNDSVSQTMSVCAWSLLGQTISPRGEPRECIALECTVKKSTSWLCSLPSSEGRPGVASV
ncbi:hypothetical protein ARMSODRAFT_599423 [Armillaria solidipes]|uniref:Uncharacterized protein n=1 Tax=Armillaria solidipes TaxID=1076256 RepID=A0A2H3AVC6_9AGAR|nr:hypothetical protein ARMSODRAFT_599423 [Armillaria solidipes]